jgi:hypothetical protein
MKDVAFDGLERVRSRVDTIDTDVDAIDTTCFLRRESSCHFLNKIEQYLACRVAWGTDQGVDRLVGSAFE